MPSQLPADDDNVIPVLDGDWFADDITPRFRQFLRVAFGEEHYDENLAFIEQALNVKGKRNYSLRDYFQRVLCRPCEALQEAPHLLAVQQPKGSFNADLHAPLPPGHGERSAEVPARLPRKLGTEKERQASVSINPATSQGDKTRPEGSGPPGQGAGRAGGLRA